MKKADQKDNKQYKTKTRASFLRDRIDNRCSSSMFRKYVHELHRLEGILLSGEDDKPDKPDVYDRMLTAWKRKKAGLPSEASLNKTMLLLGGGSPSPSPAKTEPLADVLKSEAQAMVSMETKRASMEGFLGQQVRGRYDGRDHSGLGHASASTRTGLEKHIEHAVKDPSRSADNKLEEYMSERYQLDNFMHDKGVEEEQGKQLQRRMEGEVMDSSAASETSEEPPPPKKKVEQEYEMPAPKHFHKISVRQPLMMKNMTVFRGGKKEQSKTSVEDEGQADSGADLFQSLVAVVNLFRGKSRMQIDMLMKNFIKHARIEGAKGEGQDVAIGPQGFRNWMHSAQVHDMFLVDRLYKAADVSKDGEVSFIEFRRAVQRLRGTLEQRLEMYVRIFDSSGMGALDIADVSKLIAMGMPSASPAEIGEYVKVLFEKMDADGSGSLSFSEILDGIADYPKLRDQLERTVI